MLISELVPCVVEVCVLQQSPSHFIPHHGPGEGVYVSPSLLHHDGFSFCCRQCRRWLRGLGLALLNRRDQL